MPLLIFAVLFAVVQTPPPVPRQAANKQASQAAEHHSKVNTGQSNSAIPISTGQPPTAPHGDSTANPAAPRNTEGTVSVRELPAVTVSTDGWNIASVILTGIYVLLTATLVGIGFFGVRYARRSLLAIESQLEKMGQQVTEMQSAGQQTQQIIERMKDTAKKELRAYVCISTAQIAFIQERAPSVEVQLKNSGKTPAHDVRMWIALGDGPYPWRTFPPAPEGLDMSISVIGPGEEPQAMEKQFRVFPEDLKLIIGTPILSLYVWGKVTYRDIFGDEWYTEYRLMFGGAERQMLRLENGIPVAFLRTDSEGNKAT